MAFVADPVASINLISCIAIVIFSTWWYRKAQSYIPLTIGAAFGLFAINHLATLFDLASRLKSFLIIIGVIAYLLVAFGLFFITHGITRRRETEIAWEEINTNLEQRVRDRTAELAATNKRLKEEITGRARVETALQNVNKKLNLLTGITRHDILNQLTALRNYLELSRRQIKDPAVLDLLQREEHVTETIERQIAFTRDYQELGIMAPGWQNVNTTVRNASARLSLRSVRVEVTFNNLEIFADPLFEKVFYNLVDNALRYAGDSLSTIRFSSRESAGGLVVICEDDGAGITADDKNKLFTRGFGKHTGLGLFLSREILSITGITITETGEPGKGARFEITVPKGAWRYTQGK